jgi:hypothetical protein
MKKQSNLHDKANCTKKQKRHLDIALNESSDAVLHPTKKVFPHSTKANRSDYICDFTQSY